MIVAGVVVAVVVVVVVWAWVMYNRMIRGRVGADDTCRHAVAPSIPVMGE